MPHPGVRGDQGMAEDGAAGGEGGSSGEREWRWEGGRHRAALRPPTVQAGRQAAGGIIYYPNALFSQ